MEAIIDSLFIYPVKGFKGIELPSALITAKGFEYDRYWMLINPKNQFVTQRQLPRFALIKVELTEQQLIMSFDDEQMAVNLNPENFPHNREINNGVQETNASQENSDTKKIYDTQGQSIKATIWGDTCDVIAESADVSKWLTEKLQAPWPLRLVRMRQGFQRVVDQSDKLGDGKTVTTNFADGFPFLVASQASLAALNDYSGQDFPMNRFRPNIVIQTEQPFVEHKAAKLKINNIELSMDFPCERCVVTTIDQTTAEKNIDQEPLKSLIQLNPMPNKINAAAFGQNASVVTGIGKRLTKGQACELLL